MEYKFEHIEVEAPDEEWIEDLARMFAEIIYAQMVQEVKGDEEVSDMV